MARIETLKAEARRVIAAYDGTDLDGVVAQLAAIGRRIEDELAKIP